MPPAPAKESGTHNALSIPLGLGDITPTFTRALKHSNNDTLTNATVDKLGCSSDTAM